MIADERVKKKCPRAEREQAGLHTSSVCGLPLGQGQPNWQSPCCVCYGVDPLVSGELSWAVLVAEYFMLTQWVRKGLAPDKPARLDWQGKAVCRWRET